MSLAPAIIDSHVHQWDPRTTPREASVAVKLFGWSPRLLDFVVRHAMPKALVDFVGRGEYVLNPYLPGDLRSDWGRHQARLRGVVHVQAGWKGKRHIDVVDETRWLERIDPEGRTIRAIVGAAHLEAPDLGDVLDAHQRASTRFRGVRDMLAAHPSEAIFDFERAPGLIRNPAWREGYALLGKRGLTFDAWMYHHQLDEFGDLVRSHPETKVVLCHLATPIAIAGPYGGLGVNPTERARIADEWKEALANFASIPHVCFKISGLLMPIIGLGAEHGGQSMTEQELVDRVGPLVEWAIGTIGIDRCMFGSNFPIDKVSIDYTTLISGFDALLSARTDADKAKFFAENAREFYAIEQ
ncbi:MAG: amidohydrolase family protein [Deltaproteobacteria bacterium]|jgi:predicted TIM-barrel fold metal-dependent hydrolase|nr:amidohydrolase family protein [Deltaproteobacteria bacterium]